MTKDTSSIADIFSSFQGFLRFYSQSAKISLLTSVKEAEDLLLLKNQAAERTTDLVKGLVSCLCPLH